MSVADFSTDIARPDVKVAEELVYQALIRKGVPVQDCRDQCLAWDFRLIVNGSWKTVDVKYDSYVERSERFPFEGIHIGLDGSQWNGWGLHDDLDYVAVVGVSMESAFVIDLKELRPFVLTNLMADAKPGWKPFHQQNNRNPNRPPYTTHGWAIPLSHLETAGIVVHRLRLKQKRAA